MPLAHNSVHPVRVAPRDIAGCWDTEDTRDKHSIAAVNDDLIAHFDCVCRFCKSAVDVDSACVAKLLSHGAARAQTAGFKE